MTRDNYLMTGLKAYHQSIIHIALTNEQVTEIIEYCKQNHLEEFTNKCFLIGGQAK